MPEVRAPHLVSWLFEIGPIAAGGMGPTTISNQEIAAWAALTAIELTPLEARTLRALSRAYLSEMNAAEDPSRPEPWQPEEADRAAVAQDMRTAIRALAQM